MQDLELHMDLSEEDQSQTITDAVTENASKMQDPAIIEEESSQQPSQHMKTITYPRIPTPEGHEVPLADEPVIYHDFLGRQQT